MKDFYVSKVTKIISKIQYATLATVSSGGDPYNAPVFTAYNDDLVFYWSSSIKSQHSQNIKINGKVFMAIYDSTVAQGTGWGVYIQAGAGEVLLPDEAEDALRLLGDRRGRVFSKSASDMVKSDQRIYKATPQKIWINDAEQDVNGEYIRDYRVVINLNEVKESRRSGART